LYLITIDTVAVIFKYYFTDGTWIHKFCNAFQLSRCTCWAVSKSYHIT